jgi:hypothetical protein
LIFITLVEENAKLKQKLEELENPTPKTIVKKMISSNERSSMIWMSDLRSYGDKQHLLDISVESYEPNTILTVLLYLRVCDYTSSNIYIFDCEERRKRKNGEKERKKERLERVV